MSVSLTHGDTRRQLGWWDTRLPPPPPCSRFCKVGRAIHRCFIFWRAATQAPENVLQHPFTSQVSKHTAGHKRIWRPGVGSSIPTFGFIVRPLYPINVSPGHLSRDMRILYLARPHSRGPSAANAELVEACSRRPARQPEGCQAASHGSACAARSQRCARRMCPRNALRPRVRCTDPDHGGAHVHGHVGRAVLEERASDC